MKKILLLVTKNDFLTGSLKSATRTVNTDVIKTKFEENGYSVRIERFEEITDFDQYKNWFVLYASDEAPGLFYKSYIEDVVLCLEQAGAILLPRFEMFRAHHNKSYMEMRRSLLKDDRFKTIESYACSSYEQLLLSQFLDQHSYPYVVKASAGAGSSKVILAHNASELKKAAKRMESVSYSTDIRESVMSSRCVMLLRRLRRKILHNNAPLKKETQKFIIQTYIDGLSGDYKVLAFGNKYYVLSRKNRKNDFRASGSGLFVFPTDLSEISAVLDFARDAYKELNTPICSLDIGTVNDTCHLIEYQCLNFGPYTLQFSPCWFEYDSNGNWNQFMGESVLETEYVEATVKYIESHF